jgi:hypothetical protein
MATDFQGNDITPEQLEGMERFNGNAVPMKLERHPSTIISINLEETYADTHEEDAAVYGEILPSQIYDASFPLTLGEEFVCSKQYTERISSENTIIKRFRVVSIDKEINQTVGHFALFITVSVVPVEE